MVTLKTHVLVPEDRRITVTLPPETPVGEVEVQLMIESADNRVTKGSNDKFDREWQAFRDMLPELLTQYPGQYVAIHEGNVVGSGEDGVAVSLAAHRKYGNVPIVVNKVAESPRVVHLRTPFRRLTHNGQSR